MNWDFDVEIKMDFDEDEIELYNRVMDKLVQLYSCDEIQPVLQTRQDLNLNTEELKFFEEMGDRLDTIQSRLEKL